MVLFPFQCALRGVDAEYDETVPKYCNVNIDPDCSKGCNPTLDADNCIINPKYVEPIADPTTETDISDIQ